MTLFSISLNKFVMRKMIVKCVELGNSWINAMKTNLDQHGKKLR